MKLDAKKYDEMRKAASPPSPLLKDCLWAVPSAFWARACACCMRPWASHLPTLAH